MNLQVHILCDDNGDTYCLYRTARFFGQSTVCYQNIYIFYIAYLTESSATELGRIGQNNALCCGFHHLSGKIGLL